MIIHRRGRVAEGRYANAKEIDDRGSWIRGSIDRKDIIAGISPGGRDTTMILRNRAALVAG